MQVEDGVRIPGVREVRLLQPRRAPAAHATTARGSCGARGVACTTIAAVALTLAVAWSGGTRFVVGALDASSNTGDSTEMRVLVLDAGDLSRLTDLGARQLSVWVK